MEQLFLTKIINWSITNKYNLDCDFCFRLLDEDANYCDKEKIINYLISANIKRIPFTGGEPLLDHDLEKLLMIYKSNDIFYSVHTNGINKTKLLRIMPYAN